MTCEIHRSSLFPPLRGRQLFWLGQDSLYHSQNAAGLSSIMNLETENSKPVARKPHSASWQVRLHFVPGLSKLY